MHRIAVIVATILVAALLGLPGPFGREATADTWSGTWARNEVNGNLILQESGSTVTGHYTWNDGSGTVAGTVAGVTLDGTFNETHYRGSFTLTLTGTTFTGSYTGTNKDTGGDIAGPFTGTCTGGACLANGQPVVTTVPPPGGFDIPVIADALGGGMAVATESPPLGDAKAVTATAEGLSREDVVLIARLTAQSYCVLQTTRSLVTFIKRQQTNLLDLQDNALRYQTFLENLSDVYAVALASCLAIANEIVDKELATGGGADVRPGATPAARAVQSTTCPITPIRVALRHSHGQTRARGFRVVGTKGLAMSCSLEGGVWTLHLASKSGKPLSKLIGPRLFIGVARSKNDPPDGTLTFNYHQG